MTQQGQLAVRAACIAAVMALFAMSAAAQDADTSMSAENSSAPKATARAMAQPIQRFPGSA